MEFTENWQMTKILTDNLQKSSFNDSYKTKHDKFEAVLRLKLHWELNVFTVSKVYRIKYLSVLVKAVI